MTSTARGSSSSTGPSRSPSPATTATTGTSRAGWRTSSPYSSWTFDWLDVPNLLRRSDVIFEYPMVDRDPVDRWTFGRVTLLGDAAHPMYPRGSNGAAQAILDARALAECLAE